MVTANEFGKVKGTGVPSPAGSGSLPLAGTAAGLG